MPRGACETRGENFHESKIILIPAAISVFCVAASCAEACTTTIVTKGASAEGVVYVTHSNDAFSSDPNIVYVPAKDHPEGSMRAVRPDHPMTLAEIMDLHRDAYEGTPIDRREGNGAGLFASPYRYGDSKWERTITARHIAYTWITQAGDSLPCPMFWLSMNAPAESVYIPFAVAPLPEAYEKADRTKCDMTKAWWISQQVTILTRGYYSALSPVVRDAAHEWERRSAKLVTASARQSAEEFAQTLRENAGRVLADWRELHGRLLSVNDGDRRIDYDGAHRPAADKVEKY